MNVLFSVALILCIAKCDGCGVRQIGHRELVTHGFETKPGSFPWHVAIYHQESSGIAYKCGGSLIQGNVVLTAAHCVFDKFGRVLNPQRMVLHLGKHSLSHLEAHTRVSRARIIYIHPNFNSSTLENDIAKVELSEYVDNSQYIQPICLWDKNRKSIFEVENRMGTVVGWGFTEKDKTSDVLREATMPIVSTGTCLKSNRGFFGNFLSDSTFCAGYRNGTSVCNGDSGGGMYFEEDGVWKLRGIVSISTSRENSGLCSSRDYVIFTDVAQYLQWIDSSKTLIGCLKGNHDILPKGNVIRARSTDFPWSAVVYNVSGINFQCSATVISPNAVLTRASCVCSPGSTEALPPTAFAVGAGIKSKISLDNRWSEVGAIKVHEKFNAESGENDLALMFLKQDLKFSDRIQPVCFTSKFGESQDEAYYVSGWEDGNNDLIVSSLDIQTEASCLLAIKRNASTLVTDKTLCFKHRFEPSTIHTTSQLIAFDGEVWYLRGIRQKPSGFENESVLLYRNVNDYLGWISEAITPYFSVCGKRKTTRSTTQSPKPGEFPWHAMVYYQRAKKTEYICGGVLVTKYHVISTASCFYDQNTKLLRITNDLSIHFGIHKLHHTDQQSEEIPVFKVIPHPNFEPESLANNIAIVVLANAVTFSDYIQPVCLWDPEKNDEIENQMGSIISFGREIFENAAEGPDRIEMPIVSKRECIASKSPLQSFNHTTSFCGGFRNGSLTACSSDSGVGLVFEIGDVSFVRGLLSGGFEPNRNCTRNNYVEFVDLEPYLEWIKIETYFYDHVQLWQIQKIAEAIGFFLMELISFFSKFQ